MSTNTSTPIKYKESDDEGNNDHDDLLVPFLTFPVPIVQPFHASLFNNHFDFLAPIPEIDSESSRDAINDRFDDPGNVFSTTTECSSPE